jgi:hypothetical protein
MFECFSMVWGLFHRLYCATNGRFAHHTLPAELFELNSCMANEKELVPPSWTNAASNYAELLLLNPLSALISGRNSPFMLAFAEAIAESERISQIFAADNPSIFSTIQSAAFTLQPCLDSYECLFQDFPFHVQYLSSQVGYIWNGFKPPYSTVLDLRTYARDRRFLLSEFRPNPVPAHTKERDALEDSLQKRISAQAQLLAVLSPLAVLLPTSLQDLWSDLFESHHIDVDLDPEIVRIRLDVTGWMDRFADTVSSIAFYVDEPPDSLLRMDKLLALPAIKAKYFRSRHHCDFFPTPCSDGTETVVSGPGKVLTFEKHQTEGNTVTDQSSNPGLI